MERLRNELWTSLKEQRAVKPRLRFVLLSARLAFWSAAFVLVSATPLALPQESPWKREKPVRAESLELEWVTPDERALLGNLRKRLSDGNTFAVMPDPVERPEAPAHSAATSIQAARQAARRKTAAPETQPEPASIPYDHIITLVRTGERALKNQAPTILVEQ
jgi:hypothetical protein